MPEDNAPGQLLYPCRQCDEKWVAEDFATYKYKGEVRRTRTCKECVRVKSAEGTAAYRLRKKESAAELSRGTASK